MQSPAFISIQKNQAILTYKSAHRVSSLETFNALTSQSVKTINQPSAINSDPVFFVPTSFASGYTNCNIVVDCFACLLISDGPNIFQLATTVITYGNITGSNGIQINGSIIPGSFSIANNSMPLNYVPSTIDVSATELLMSAWPSFTNSIFGIGAGAIHRVQLSYNIKAILTNGTN